MHHRKSERGSVHLLYAANYTGLSHFAFITTAIPGTDAAVGGVVDVTATGCFARVLVCVSFAFLHSIARREGRHEKYRQ